MKLLVVESPAKAKTLTNFLGSEFHVVATYGHVRDLPKHKLGVDAENDFAPQWVVPTKSKPVVSTLKKEITKAEEVYLATDGDREGEAIAHHVAELASIPPKKLHRLVFYEITKRAVLEALAHPREINEHLVNAQYARRVLDRVVGYTLSPLLWKKIKRGLSAGRVQSVALRLLAEREEAIAAFKPVRYFRIWAELKKGAGSFPAQLTAKDGRKLKTTSIDNEREADEIAATAQTHPFVVTEIRSKTLSRTPAPPFITSTLQQEAAKVLGFSPKKTMVVAQQLYEGVDLGKGERVGLITYMRTDSFHLADEAVTMIRDTVSAKFGPNYLPPAPRAYTKKVKRAQEAHEAIRPTHPSYAPETVSQYLTKEQLRLYGLIWKRAIASQMIEARVELTEAELAVKNLTFTAKGERILEHGFIKVYEAKEENGESDELKGRLPKLTKGEELALKELHKEEKFTDPPPRFTEASLIKTLEELGVGRPSTYAPTISTLVERRYAQLEQKKFHATELGVIVAAMLKKNFPFVVDAAFTAKMEEDLDDVASGEKAWPQIVRALYGPLTKEVAEKSVSLEKIELPVHYSNEPCPKCGSRMVIKSGRFGDFLACSRFPECKGTKAIVRHLGIQCPLCGNELIERKTRRGRLFFGCTSYPKCHFASWDEPLARDCPQCGHLLFRKRQLIFCKNCDFRQADTLPEKEAV